MKIALVLGKQPEKGVPCAPELVCRVRMAVSLLRTREADLVVISGGKTRKDSPSEAEAGFQYVPINLRDKTLIESKAKSTVDNILFTKKLLQEKGIELGAILVVTHSYHMPRVRHLFRKLWPEVLVEPVEIQSNSFKKWLVEWVLLVIAFFDPRDRFILPPIKRILRNA